MGEAGNLRVVGELHASSRNIASSSFDPILGRMQGPSGAIIKRPKAR